MKFKIGGLIKYLLIASVLFVVIPFKVSFAWDTTALPAFNGLSEAQKGRAAWLKYNCAGCHGDNASGGMGPGLRGEADDVAEAIKQGESAGMPKYKGVTANEIKFITAYLKSTNTISEPKFVCWWVNPPPDINYTGVGVRPNCR